MYIYLFSNVPPYSQNISFIVPHFNLGQYYLGFFFSFETMEQDTFWSDEKAKCLPLKDIMESSLT